MELVNTHLLISKHVKAIKAGDYIHGSCGPRYYHSSFVLVQSPQTSNHRRLPEVQFYAECTVVLKHPNVKHTKWLAAVSGFSEHPCHVWYGNPCLSLFL